MSDSHNKPDRLREHPEQRFTASHHLFDLNATVQELMAEPSDALQGHRQITLYKRGRATVALFIFGSGAYLPHHVAAGTVTLNVLQGHLSVDTPEGHFDMPAGKLLVLASGVRHDVKALQPSTLLLQVHLDEPVEAAR